MSPSRGEAEQMFNLLDYDGSGEVQVESLQHWSNRNNAGNAGVLVECWDKWDPPTTNELIKDEWLDAWLLIYLPRWCLLNSHMRWCQSLFLCFVTMEGEISYQEFVDGCWKLQGEAEFRKACRLTVWADEWSLFLWFSYIVSMQFAGEWIKFANSGIQASNLVWLSAGINVGISYSSYFIQARSLDMKIIQLAPWPWASKPIDSDVHESLWWF